MSLSGSFDLIWGFQVAMEQNIETDSTSNATETIIDDVPVKEKSEPVDEDSNDGSKKNESTDDPYAYLNRKEFTSEKFKIEVKRLPKYYGLKELKKLLNNKLKLNSTKIKVPSPRSPWVYVCFRSEEDKTNAINLLNNYQWKNSSLKAVEANPVPDPLVQKRIQNSNENEPVRKKPKLDGYGISDKMKDATTPLWKVPYMKQLDIKTELINTLLKQYGNKLVKTNSALSNWLKEQKTKYKGLPCEVLPIRHANEITGYRNKCEFSVGFNEETNEKTIGFRLGRYVKGSVSVAPVDDAFNVPEQMKLSVRAFQKFIQNSELDVFNPELHEGYWRQLTARYGFKTDQLLLAIGIDPQDMSNADLSELKNKIKEYFTVGEGKLCNVTSLYLKILKNFSSAVYEHVFGETYITEKLLGRTFRISPQAFFQINTNAAEILYRSIAELAELTPDAALLDVCCGTGSIGICLSDKCGEVLGLEISPEAIADAEANSAFNQVSNAQFYAGKAEEILSCVAQKATKEDIIAVVDPPRAGLQHDALVQLRKCERIKKLVYVSCDPKGAIKNFIDLGRACSKIYKGDPFVPVRAIPVDLFPFTNHCELLIYFERKSTT